MTGKYKRMLLLNLPYVLIALLGTKLGEAWRYSPGLDISQKVLHLMDGFALAFMSPWPSLLQQDLILGIVIAVGIKVAVYVKGRNANKYRKNIEYGSARWGRSEDIKPVNPLRSIEDTIEQNDNQFDGLINNIPAVNLDKTKEMADSKEDKKPKKESVKQGLKKNAEKQEISKAVPHKIT